MIPSPNNKKAWETYMYKKSIESYDDMCSEFMGIGDCIDENGDSVDSEEWYWRGCSSEMNEDIDDEEDFS